MLCRHLWSNQGAAKRPLENAAASFHPGSSHSYAIAAVAVDEVPGEIAHHGAPAFLLLSVQSSFRLSRLSALQRALFNGRTDILAEVASRKVWFYDNVFKRPEYLSEDVQM